MTLIPLLFITTVNNQRLARASEVTPRPSGANRLSQTEVKLQQKERVAGAIRFSRCLAYYVCV